MLYLATFNVIGLYSVGVLGGSVGWGKALQA